MQRPRPDRPGPGQEPVWDYPRPPRLERTDRRIRAYVNGECIADTTRAYRVLETSHPPTYYVPPEDVRLDLVVPGKGSSHCEWKGRAEYFDADLEGRRFPRVAWTYPEPTRGFLPIREYLAFYLPNLDEGFVDDERAKAQPGGFYGGWITADLAGPFKGEPGSWGW